LEGLSVARRRKDDPYNQLTVSKPLSITLDDGTIAEGTLWMPASHSGRFEVEYKGMRRTDYRTDYTNEGQIRLIAILILKELVDAEQQRIAREAKQRK
jgi:hypothetical protein